MCNTGVMMDGCQILLLQILMYILSSPMDGGSSRITIDSRQLKHTTLQGLGRRNDTLRADVACQAEAESRGLRGVYSALLSTGVRQLRHLVQLSSHHLPVVNIRVSAANSQWITLYTLQHPYEPREYP